MKNFYMKEVKYTILYLLSVRTFVIPFYNCAGSVPNKLRFRLRLFDKLRFRFGEKLWFRFRNTVSNMSCALFRSFSTMFWTPTRTAATWNVGEYNYQAVSWILVDFRVSDPYSFDTDPDPAL
jgi:hypothetical protein